LTLRPKFVNAFLMSWPSRTASSMLSSQEYGSEGSRAARTVGAGADDVGGAVATAVRSRGDASARAGRSTRGEGSTRGDGDGSTRGEVSVDISPLGDVTGARTADRGGACVSANAAGAVGSVASAVGWPSREAGALRRISADDRSSGRMSPDDGTSRVIGAAALRRGSPDVWASLAAGADGFRGASAELRGTVGGGTAPARLRRDSVEACDDGDAGRAAAKGSRRDGGAGSTPTTVGGAGR